jgi:hypothetical protein
VLQGTLLVIPIEESLLYIRPLYLRSQGGRIPELKRVIVAYQNQIVMEETLHGALDRLFPRGGGPTPAVAPVQASVVRTEPSPGADSSQSRKAVEHYQRALKAQREGNWAVYGDEIRQLGEVLEQMTGSR